MTFIETSAFNGENVNEAFNLLAKNILTKIESGLIDTTELKPKVLNRINNGVEKNTDYGCNYYCSKNWKNYILFSMYKINFFLIFLNELNFVKEKSNVIYWTFL